MQILRSFFDYFGARYEIPNFFDGVAVTKEQHIIFEIAILWVNL